MQHPGFCIDVASANQITGEETAGELFRGLTAKARGFGPARARVRGGRLVERPRNPSPAQQEKLRAQCFEVVENMTRDQDTATVAGELAEDVAEFLTAH